MLLQTLLRAHRLALFVTLVVALVATGFGHRTPAPLDRMQALAFAIGASPADLCGGGADGSDHDAPPCLACQIAGSAGVPPALLVLADLDHGHLAKPAAPRESRAYVRVLDPGHGPQAPPLV